MICGDCRECPTKCEEFEKEKIEATVEEWEREDAIAFNEDEVLNLE